MINNEVKENKLRITIITSTFNCADSLMRTIKSVRAQTYNNIQWIIADGLSKDNTVDIITKNVDVITDWFSESDSGIYDAWNKAAKLINGDWVLFLGAGDVLFDATTIQEIARKLSTIDENISIAYGKVVSINSDGKIIRIFGEQNSCQYEYGRPWVPHHQGAFQRADLFMKPKPFDDSLRIVSDQKFMVWCGLQGQFQFIDTFIAYMTDDGISANPLFSYRQSCEMKRAMKDIEVKVPLRHAYSHLYKSAIKNIIAVILGGRFYSCLRNMKRRLFFGNIKLN